MDPETALGGKYTVCYLIHSMPLNILIFILQVNPLAFENYFLKRISFEIGERHIATYKMSFDNKEVLLKIS